MLKLITGCGALMAVLVAAPAFGAPDDCSADANERSVFIAKAIINELDRRRGAANHPDWMRSYLGDPDLSGTRLASYCGENPQAKLATAIELLK